MTDKYLTHTEAAKAKAEGKEVQTRTSAGWRPFDWLDLNMADGAQFRLAPPAPRVAREWWITLHPSGQIYNDLAHREPMVDAIHVREVVPGEPSVRETLDRAEQMFVKCVSGMVTIEYGTGYLEALAHLRRELCGEDEVMKS